MPKDAVSRTANVERTGRHKWVNMHTRITMSIEHVFQIRTLFEMQTFIRRVLFLYKDESSLFSVKYLFVASTRIDSESDKNKIT